MAIQIAVPSGTAVSEMVMLEFQGEFEHTEQVQLEGLELGQLEKKEGENYELKVGNHLLKGKEMTLAKPLIFTEKLKEEYQIKATIRKKILFMSRPTPLKNDKRLRT